MAADPDDDRQWIARASLQHLLALSESGLNKVRGRLGKQHERKKGQVIEMHAPRWLHHWARDHGRSSLPAPAGRGRTTEEILLEGASPELKEEYLRQQIREKSSAADLKGMQVLQQQEAHLPIAEVRAFLMHNAQLIAKKREHLERVIKDDGSRALVSRAFEDLADDIVKYAERLEAGEDDLP